MKHYLFPLPVVALMCGAAFAQTSDTSTADPMASDGMYGTTWSQSTGAMFYSDPEMTKMRTPDEIGTSWSSLPQQDRDAVLADCARYRMDTGATAATGTETTENAPATDTTTTTEGATDGTASTTMGVSADNMKMICDLAETY